MSIHRAGQTAAERIAELKRQRDTARGIAVALEQRLAAVAALAEDLWLDGERATRRRAYATGVALKGSAVAIRAALDPEAGET